MKKYCFVTTNSLIVNSFLVPCLATLGRAYRVRLALNPDEDTAAAEGHRAEVITLPILRKISPRSDLSTRAAIVRLFRDRRFDAVHPFSPKFGLLVTIAGWIASAPVSSHTYTGQVWITRFGILKSLLAAVRRELGITPDATVFLFLGRLTRDKGVSDLAQAFARLATVQWRNFIAGTGLAWASAALLTSLGQ